MSSSDDDTRQKLTSGGLVLYDAVSFHELLRQSDDDLPTLRRRYRDVGTWKRALSEGFTAAAAVNDDTVFPHAIEILDHLPNGPDVESALADIYEAARFVVSRAGLLRQDLSGRIYHSALGRTLAKNFATYYTKIPASDLLAWLAVEEWDDTVADFACGSGTLPNSSYSRKLSLALPEATEADDGIDDLDDVHRRFLENDIFGLDAMRFPARLTMVNLAMQRPTEFESSNIYHVPVTNREFGTNKVGSLDLLDSNTIDVRRRIDGRDMGAGERAMGAGAEPDDVTIPQEFDVVIMNPPFTRKDRATKLLDTSRVNELASEHDAEVTGQTGLAAPFVLLGDHYLDSGGRLALVLPSAVVDRYSWEPVREMLAENYDVEHMIVSWGPGEPAWSEDSDRREVLIIARKRGDDENGRSHTIVSHIDEAITFAEARDISQLLGRTDAANISIRSPNTQVLSSGSQQLGGAKSFPPAFLDDHTDNWYRFAAYRNPDVVRLMLALEGIMSPEEAPYGIDLGDVTSQLSHVADVQLFLKNIKPAGYRVDDEPSDGGDWTVNTSTINKIALSEDDDGVQWVFRDRSLAVTESFTYDTGDLLVTEGGDFYHSMRITATAPERPATGSVWFPVDVPDLESVDGKRITSNEAGKVIAAWLNSVVGIVPLFGYRAEVRGARGKFKTKQLRRVTVLDPSKLTRKQVDDMLHAYEEVKDTEWGIIRTQLEQALGDPTHPRRRLDEGVLDALMDEQPDIDALEADLLDEINRLGRIMNG